MSEKSNRTIGLCLDLQIKVGAVDTAELIVTPILDADVHRIDSPPQYLPPKVTHLTVRSEVVGRRLMTFVSQLVLLGWRRDEDYSLLHEREDRHRLYRELDAGITAHEVGELPRLILPEGLIDEEEFCRRLLEIARGESP